MANRVISDDSICQLVDLKEKMSEMQGQLKNNDRAYEASLLESFLGDLNSVLNREAQGWELDSELSK